MVLNQTLYVQAVKLKECFIMKSKNHSENRGAVYSEKLLVNIKIILKLRDKSQFWCCHDTTLQIVAVKNLGIE
jgi:hypothetical protein